MSKWIDKEPFCNVSKDEIKWFISKKNEIESYSKGFVVSLLQTCKNLYLHNEYLTNRNEKFDHISQEGKKVYPKVEIGDPNKVCDTI